MLTKTTQKSLFAASATAISAIGLLIGPAPAQALPMLPLSSACTQWGFPGAFSFRQSNHWRLDFHSTGTRAQGEAVAEYYGPGDADALPAPMHGTISGGVDGYAVKLEVRWSNGALGKYEGSVDANGFAHGTAYDAKTPSSTATWDSNSPLDCVTPNA